MLRSSVLVIAACSGASHSGPAPAPAPAAAQADPADPKLPLPRTGTTAIAEGPALDAKVVSHFVGKQLETVRLDLTGRGCGVGAIDHGIEVAVDLGTGRARAQGVVREKVSVTSHDDVLIARPREQTGQPIAGDVYVPPGCRATGIHFRFAAPASPSALSDPQLPLAWANELADQIGGNGWRPSDAWHAFARARLHQLGGNPTTNRPAIETPSADEVARLMETTTGVDALQEALQADRGLIVASEAAKPT